jgi:hypothetical protein
MSNERSKPQALAYTARVLLAAAAAQDDVQWMRRHGERCYEFCLMAAADQQVPALPGERYDKHHLMKIDTMSASGELHLALQAEGYAALARMAHRQARLRSLDGAINQRLRFDGDGRALLVLDDTDVIHRALAQFHVIVDEPEPMGLETPRDPGPRG